MIVKMARMNDIVSLSFNPELPRIFENGYVLEVHGANAILLKPASNGKKGCVRTNDTLLTIGQKAIVNFELLPIFGMTVVETTMSDSWGSLNIILPTQLMPLNTPTTPRAPRVAKVKTEETLETTNPMIELKDAITKVNDLKEIMGGNLVLSINNETGKIKALLEYV